jgi:hypothetical protein
MKNSQKSKLDMYDEKIISSIPAKSINDDSNKSSKNLILLRDLPQELRTKEASKPMYLTRYE